MRNLFYRMTNAVARFMYGRNGTDQLNAALLAVYLVIYILQIFLSRFSAARMILNVLTLLVGILLVFRLFSKNLAKRREENARFLRWWTPIQRRISGARQRGRDKEHKYFTCKNCKTICRVPAGKGKLEITCPKCGSKIIGKS